MQADNLIEFVTVARSGSLALASERLNLSQSSLSRHMRDLERELGITLLRRMPNGVELTEEGRHVYQRASDMAEIVDDIALYAARAAKPASRRTLKVAGALVLPSYARVLVEAAAPDELAFADEGEAALQPALELLAQGRADLCLVRGVELTPDIQERFCVEKFSDEAIVALMEPGHPLATRASIAIGDLEGCLLLHADSYRDYAHFAWVELKALLRKHGVNYLAETRSLRTDGDWLTSSLGNGVVVLTASHRMVPTLKAYGRACVPVVGDRYVFYSVYPRDDERARQLAADAAGRLKELQASTAPYACAATDSAAR